MLNLYPTISSIEKDWKITNSEIEKVFDKKSFDLDAKEFEEKCNKVLQDLISHDSKITIARLIGIAQDTIYNFIGDNFNPDNPHEIFLNRLHLLIYDKKTQKTTTSITFPDSTNSIYTDNVLSGMPKVFKAETNQDEFIPFAKSFDRYIAGKIRYSMILNLGMNSFLLNASDEEFKIIQEKAPTRLPFQNESYFSVKNSDFFSIPPSERFRISSLVAHAFGIELRDGSKIIQKYCSSTTNPSIYNISSCELLKKSLGKFFWINHDDVNSGLYSNDGSIQLIKNSRENFLPSEYSQYTTIIHEYGHHLLYNYGHPNFNSTEGKFKYFTRNTNDYFFGSFTSSERDKFKTFLTGYYSQDDSCDNSSKLGPIDFLTLKFAQYCSYRFQNNTEIGRNYRRDFEKINLTKIDTDFCLPLVKIDLSKKILFDSCYNFIFFASVIFLVDSLLACVRGKNSTFKDSREKNINLISTILGPFIHGLDSLLINGAKFSLSKTLNTNFVKKITELALKKIKYDNSTIKKLLTTVNKSYEELPKVAKNSLKTFATYHLLFFLKDMIGKRPIITSSENDFSKFGNLYYDRNIEIFSLFFSALISSSALGLFSFISEKMSDKIYESINSNSGNNATLSSNSSNNVPASSPEPLSSISARISENEMITTIISNPSSTSILDFSDTNSETRTSISTSIYSIPSTSTKTYDTNRLERNYEDILIV